MWRFCPDWERQGGNKDPAHPSPHSVPPTVLFLFDQERLTDVFEGPPGWRVTPRILISPVRTVTDSVAHLVFVDTLPSVVAVMWLPAVTVTLGWNRKLLFFPFITQFPWISSNRNPDQVLCPHEHRKITSCVTSAPGNLTKRVVVQILFSLRKPDIVTLWFWVAYRSGTCGI